MNPANKVQSPVTLPKTPRSARELQKLEYLSGKQLAELLGISESTVTLWRAQGKGPAWIKCGRSVRYARADVDAWLEQNRQGPLRCDTPGSGCDTARLAE